MSNRDKILNFLHDNKNSWISGEQISVDLGISRTAVWKNIKVLKENGYSIESSSKLGHKFLSTNNAINEYELRKNIQTSVFGRGEIHTYSEIDSTNVKAFALASEGAPEGTLVIAESQSKGKGRLGRRWYSVPGKGLNVSMILRPQIMPSSAPGLTMVTAVAMAEALEQSGLSSYEIKWPNDIIVDGRKAAGILSEIKTGPDVIDFIVIGFGINLNSEPSDYPEEIRDIACSIKDHVKTEIDRCEFLGKFLINFETHYFNYIEKGFKDILDLWIDKSGIINKKIKVSLINGSFTGIVKGVGDDGNLIVHTEDGIRMVNSGDINYI